MKLNLHGYAIEVNLDPLSFNSFKKNDPAKFDLELPSELILENDLIKYEFNKDGQIVSAFDKEINQEVMADEGNIFSLYEDIPNNWDAFYIMK